MGPSSFIMVLIGCAPGAQCAPIATMPVAYRSQTTCLDARAEIVAATAGLGYGKITAECRPQPHAPREAAAKAPSVA